MLKIIAVRLWSFRKEFSKYTIIGAVAFFSDLGSLFVMKEYLGFSPTMAVIINQPIITTGVFFSNKYWSFRVGGLTGRQIARYYVLATFNYAVSVIWIYYFYNIFGFHYITARFLNIMLSVSWTFLLYKYWVFK